MVRKNAYQILESSKRLTDVGLGQVPVWHSALLTHPVTPPLNINKSAVKPITYREDTVREKFFEDFPFEAMRAKTLVERQVIEEPRSIGGKAWSHLKQASSCPNAEDVVAFTVNLEEHHNHNLSQAYAIATSQFSHLRAINEHAARAALHEAEHYGADLKGGILEETVKRTENSLQSWKPRHLVEEIKASGAWVKDPSASFHALEGQFSGGQRYAEGWAKTKEVMEVMEKNAKEKIREEARLKRASAA